MATDDTRPPYDDLAAVIRAIATMPGVGESPTDRHMIVCRFCDGYEYYDGVGIDFRHDPSCVWRRARALAARLPPD